MIDKFISVTGLYCKTLIFRVHLIFTNFASSTKL